MKYVKYLLHLLKHKILVIIECSKNGLILQGIAHDCSKFKPEIFLPYARWLYRNKKKPTQIKTANNFKIAMHNHHIHSKHHWQHYCFQTDKGNLVCFEIPDKYIKEMICDWIATSKMFNNTAQEYYLAHYHEFKFAHRTRTKIEYRLGLTKRANLNILILEDKIKPGERITQRTIAEYKKFNIDLNTIFNYACEKYDIDFDNYPNI